MPGAPGRVRWGPGLGARVPSCVSRVMGWGRWKWQVKTERAWAAGVRAGGQAPEPGKEGWERRPAGHAWERKAPPPPLSGGTASSRAGRPESGVMGRARVPAHNHDLRAPPAARARRRGWAGRRGPGRVTWPERPAGRRGAAIEPSCPWISGAPSASLSACLPPPFLLQLLRAPRASPSPPGPPAARLSPLPASPLPRLLPRSRRPFLPLSFENWSLALRESDLNYRGALRLRLASGMLAPSKQRFGFEIPTWQRLQSVFPSKPEWFQSAVPPLNPKAPFISKHTGSMLRLGYRL